MKKFLFALTLCLVYIMVFANINVSAKIITTNLCEQEDIVVTWSGTWGQKDTNGTNNPGTNLVDGELSNKWGSYDIYDSKEEWVQVTFSKPETIHSFAIYQETSGAYTNIKQFTLQVQNNSEEWVTVYTSPEYDEFWYEDTGDFAEPVTCTAIRVHFTDSQAAPGTHTEPNKCAVELAEIEFYQKTEVEDTPSPEPTNTPTPKTSAPVQTDAPTTTDSGSSKILVPIIIGAVVGVLVLAVVIIAITKVKKNRS